MATEELPVETSGMKIDQELSPNSKNEEALALPTALKMYVQLADLICEGVGVGRTRFILKKGLKTCRELDSIYAHLISEMAVELSASSAALSTITELGLGEKNSDDTAILKIRAGFAAGKIIAISHQVHGAIGFTKEYELSYFTKNLNSWRNDFGNESFWEEFLGKRFLEKNNKNLWEYLT